jgi:hypothetical protein
MRSLGVIIVAFVTLAAALHPASASQEGVCVLRGKVLDETTRETLEHAIVFIAGSSIGTSTGADGAFVLRCRLAGEQQLVISLVGFERKIVRLRLIAGDSLSLLIDLSPRVLEENQIQVVGEEASEWQREFKEFEKIFRGAGEFARSCRLLNPYVIDLRMRGDTLVGSSQTLLLVENSDLGYRMRVAIRSFAWDLKRNQGLWAASIYFQELPAGSQGQREEWLERRRTVYRGSMRHFLRALIHRRLNEEGFSMRTGRSIDHSYMWPKIEEDSLRLFQDPRSLLYEWKYPEWIRVDDDRRPLSASYFRLVEPRALIEESGLLMTPLAFEVGGMWASERVGRLLPIDYSPDEPP